MSKGSYTVAQLAKKAHVTQRALRYYDQIGLIVPQRDDNGYRIYDDADVARLQHVMLLRSCGVALADIAASLAEEDYDVTALLERQLEFLVRQRDELSRSIAITKEALQGLEEFESMDDDQRFEQLKRTSVERFEEEFGQEARDRYGDAAIDEANERMLGMSKLAWDMKEDLEQRIKDALVEAMATEDPASPESRMVAGMHARWIQVHWGDGAYTPQAHVQLAQGYLDDPRFVKYYDGACGAGATAFLRDIIVANIA